MIWFLAGLFLAVAVLLSPGSAGASPTEDSLRNLVSDMGCTAEVSFITSSDFNGLYNNASHQIYLIGFENLPYPWQQAIAAHEAGHCMQAQEGWLWKMTPREREWDADRRANNALLHYGVDGAQATRELFAYLYGTYSWPGSEHSPHGLSTHRITRSLLNGHSPRLESP